MDKKAYDLKLLGEKLKEQGLDMAEEAVESAAKATFAWLKESAALSENKYDDMAVAIALPEIEKKAFEAIDKIDHKVG